MNKPINLSSHPILQQAFDVIQAIEKCGASVELTSAVTEAGKLLQAINDLLAIRELKGDQVPVALVDERQGSGGFCLTQHGRRLNLPHGMELFTAPQKPVVVLTDCDIGAVSHMAHWYSEEQCEAWVAGVEHAKKQIVAAGCIVQTGDTDTGDDHQSSAPAVLRDVLTAVSIGGSRTELIDALTAIKPKFGAPGSRDIDVRAAHVAIEKAIEKLSNL